MKIACRELTPALWPDLETLFGPRGAVGGCWYMHWRHPKGEKWADAKGAVNRGRFEALVCGGHAHGALAYVDGVPVGWASFDRRPDYDRLNRAPSFACVDAEAVWSIPCFFIASGVRGKGVASALLAFAIAAMRARGATIVEGYPVKPAKDGKPSPAAFAWTGTVSLFEKHGFVAVGKRDGGKQRMRLAPR